jgi:hypothetical protein
MSKSDRRTIQAILALFIVGLLLIAAIAWGAWQVVSALSVTALRVLVLIGILAIPIAAWVGWRLGRYEAGAVLHGVDEIGERVMGTAEKVAALRVGMHRARRSDAGSVVVMPMQLPPITHRAAIEDEIVDL